MARTKPPKPPKQTANVYFWQARPNFGDRLALPLLNHFTGREWTPSPVEEADIVSTGSILEHLPAGWGGIVAGSGKLHEEAVLDLSKAVVLGVRGLLTLRSLHVKGDVVVGDPGLLASELVKVPKARFPLGVVPHWMDRDLYLKEVHNSRRWKYVEPILIDPTGDPLEVVATIGQCDKIVTSSLHGMVVADSYGIPRRVELAETMSLSSEGGDFKFRDYGSSISQPVEFGVLQAAPRWSVERIQTEVFDMLATLPHGVPAAS